MPKLWPQTVAAHRRDVREAILDTTAALVVEQGLRGVTMSGIAEKTGIGRATLYRYFADLDTILAAWHERQVASHLDRLAEVRDQSHDLRKRLAAVLEAFAVMSSEGLGYEATGLVAGLHRTPHVERARERVHLLVREILVEGRRNGYVRDDVDADELTSYCLNALSAARSLGSRDAIHRLVVVTLDGVRGRANPARGSERGRSRPVVETTRESHLGALSFGPLPGPGDSDGG